jgi:hypothetical protein
MSSTKWRLNPLSTFSGEDHSNLKELKKTWNYLIIRDGDAHFRLRVYYIKPQEQVKQLREMGFKNIKVYSLQYGDEIQDESMLRIIKDSWLYYLCNI